MARKKDYKFELQKESVEMYFLQYIELRKEIIETIHLQVKYIQISILCLAGTFAYVFNTSKENLFMINIVHFFLIPLICYAFLGMWLGEVSRMMVYGNYIHQFELIIREHTSFKESPIFKKFVYYETWIRENQKSFHQSIKYLIVVFSFSLIAVGNSALPIINFWRTNTLKNMGVSLVTISIILNLIGMVTVVYSLKNIKDHSKSYNKVKGKQNGYINSGTVSK